MKHLVPCMVGLAACWGGSSKEPSKPAATTGAFAQTYAGMRRVSTEINDLGADLSSAGGACAKLAMVLAAGSPEETQLKTAAAERTALTDAQLAEWQTAHAAELDGWASGFIVAYRQQTCDTSDERRWPLIKTAFIAMAQPKELPPFVTSRNAIYAELLAKIPKTTDCEALMKEVGAKGEAFDAGLQAMPARLRLVDDFVWEEELEKAMESRLEALTGPCSEPFKK